MRLTLQTFQEIMIGLPRYKLDFFSKLRRTYYIHPTNQLFNSYISDRVCQIIINQIQCFPFCPQQIPLTHITVQNIGHQQINTDLKKRLQKLKKMRRLMGRTRRNRLRNRSIREELDQRPVVEKVGSKEILMVQTFYPHENRHMSQKKS